VYHIVSVKSSSISGRCILDNCNLPTSPTSGTHSVSQTQIAWNWSTVSGANGYKWSTTNNFTTATDMGTATTKIETGLTCNTAHTRYVWAYNACGNSAATTLSATTSACSFTCGQNLTVNHVAGVVAPVTKSVIYGTVTNIPGETSKCWITRNLGASQQATAVDDITEASAGWYWQFNRKQGYKNDGSTVTPAWTITAINEASDWLSANDPCAIELGTTWHVPTYTEWNNVNTTGGWTTWTGPWTSGLKMHAAGYLSAANGTLANRGFIGYSWCSGQINVTDGRNLYFYSTASALGSDNKAVGYSLRCIK
jgi:hypothetical protein